MHSIGLAVIYLCCVMSNSDIGTDFEQSRDGVTVKIESVELSRFEGELASSLGTAGELVPKIERAIVLTTSVTGTRKTAAPRIRLANGQIIDVSIHGNTLRNGVQQIKGVEGTDESWFKIEKNLPLNEVFPCTVIIGAAPENRDLINFTFRNISP